MAAPLLPDVASAPPPAPPEDGRDREAVGLSTRRSSIHRRIDDALQRALDVLPAAEREAIGTTGRHSLVEALAQRLVNDARWPQGVVSPLPALLLGVWRQLLREDATSDAAPIRIGAVNLLATAMRRGTALRASLTHVNSLSHLSNNDVLLLRDLDVRRPSSQLTRMELQCEVLRDGDVWPRRLPLLSEAATSGGGVDLMTTATLERLLLVSWADRTMLVADSPEFLRLRRAMRIGSVTVTEGLRRWLAGQHMATVLPNEPSGPSPAGVGSLTLVYRTLSLTAAGHALVAALRGPRCSPH